jgi:DNA-binding GntR family transcriptional regulator
LPAQRELVAQLRVSRRNSRKAISMLAQKGLLEIRSGSGTHVARPSAEFLGDTLEFALHFDRSAGSTAAASSMPSSSSSRRRHAKRRQNTSTAWDADCWSGNKRA